MHGFFAYPSNPRDIGETISEAVSHVDGLSTWEQMDIPGRFITDPIFERIGEADYLAADITRLNFNVLYEIGYAIGKKRRLFLVRNGALKGDDEAVREVGIFDTIGYHSYSSSHTLILSLTNLSTATPFPLHEGEINKGQPVYLVLPKSKTDFELRIQSRLDVAKLNFRFYDPVEHGRMNGRDVIKQVVTSRGVVIPFLSSNRIDSAHHNYRAAFVAGLAHGLGKVYLLLQKGEDHVPLDYRDLVTPIQRVNQIDTYISGFAPMIAEQFSTTRHVWAYPEATIMGLRNRYL